MMQTEGPPQQLSSPSFSSYSSETFAQIAARVIHELQNDPHFNNNDNTTLFDHPWPLNDNHHANHSQDPNVNDNDDQDFEFAFVSRDHSNSSPVSADDVFQNGQIRPTYPLFGRDIRLNGVVSVESVETPTVRRRLPLKALMFEERETTWSFSSSEGSSNELEGVDEGTYCVWTPRAPCKKSTSVGSSSSRRWKLRDLLLSRSHSDGKDPVLFVGPAKKNNKVAPKHSGASAVKEGDEAKRKLFFNPKLN